MTPNRLSLTWGTVVALALTTLAAVHAQETAKEKEPPSAETPEVKRVGDLNTRYRFIERYAAAENRETPEVQHQYRVAIRETVKTANEKPQGAPERSEVTFQTIYSERPAQVSPSNEVTAVVRTYEAFRRLPEPQTPPPGQRPLEGLSIWYKPQIGHDAEVLSLTEGRSLREFEYRVISQQVFLPGMTLLLPALPSRRGDTWRIPRSAIQALLGARPLNGEPLKGQFVDLFQDPKGPHWVAVVSVTGQVKLQAGDATVNARILFSFTPPAPHEPAEGKAVVEDKDHAVDARGVIVEVRMALAMVAGLPGSNGRLRQDHVRELILARQAGTLGVPVSVPETPPPPTPENSWLVYDDPAGRYHFRHPEGLALQPKLGADDDTETLVDQKPNGPDTASFALLHKTGDPALDRQLNDPEYHRKKLKADWVTRRLEVIEGTSEWLPEADWGPSRRVFRIEAALKTGGRSTKGVDRIHTDYYLVLFQRNEPLFVTSMTAQDPATPYRKQIEAMIKSFELGPSTAARAGQVASPESRPKPKDESKGAKERAVVK